MMIRQDWGCVNTSGTPPLALMGIKEPQTLTPGSALQRTGNGSYASSWVRSAAEASPPKNRNVGNKTGQTIDGVDSGISFMHLAPRN